MVLPARTVVLSWSLRPREKHRVRRRAGARRMTNDDTRAIRRSFHTGRQDDIIIYAVGRVVVFSSRGGSPARNFVGPQCVRLSCTRPYDMITVSTNAVYDYTRTCRKPAITVDDANGYYYNDNDDGLRLANTHALRYPHVPTLHVRTRRAYGGAVTSD